jgi:hypothetical protein
MDENPYRAPREIPRDAIAKRRTSQWFTYIALVIIGLAHALNSVGLFATLAVGYAASRADTSVREQAIAVFVAGIVLGILAVNLWLLSGRRRTPPRVRVVISVAVNAVLIALFAQSWLFDFRRYGSMVPPIECAGSMAIGTVSILATSLLARVTIRWLLIGLLIIVVLSWQLFWFLGK